MARWWSPIPPIRPRWSGPVVSTGKPDLPRRCSAMAPEMLIALLWKGLLQTIHMVVVSGVVGTLIGLPIGVFLATSNRGELFPAPTVNKIVGAIVNAPRPTPDRKSVVEGTRVSVRVVLGGRRIIKKKK